MTGLYHYAIPNPEHRGRWLVVYRAHGDDRWTPVMDCPTEAVARAEAERRSPICVPPPRLLLRAAADVHDMPEVVQ